MQQIVDAAGRANLAQLADENKELHAAILSFPFDAERDDYCGNCAEAMREHLASHGFADFHHHAHGHSFVANGDLIVDVWPDMDPKVWSKSDPVLKGSVYCTEGNHACWCGSGEFGLGETIPKPDAPKGASGLRM